MSDPSKLIAEYRARIAVLAKEIQSHPFHYSPGYRWKQESNFTYRRQREQEIDKLTKRIQEEETRKQLLSHAIINADLKAKGIDPIPEKKTPLDNYVRFMNEGLPISPFLKTVSPIANGIGGAVSNPLIWIAIIVGAVIILPMIFSRR